MDDDGSKSISQYEFAKACRDFKVGINDENVPLIFDLFDTNRDGCLNIDEFLMAIRGELSDYRRAFVEKAFRSIDKDGNGYLELEDIKDTYNAKKHPDVIQGKKSEDQILMEFLETFETHHSLKNRTERDSRVSLEEFVEYYANISASIDNDEYFALMMNNSWNLRGDAQTYQKYSKGWRGEEEGPSKANPDYRQPQAPVLRSGVMSKDNPLASTQDYYKPMTSASRGNTTSQMYPHPPVPKEVEIQQVKKLHKQVSSEMPPRN